MSRIAMKSIPDTKQCPHCREWIVSPHGRRELDAHIRQCPARVQLTREERQQDEQRAENAATLSGMGDGPDVATIQRASLWDGVIETYATETELNGWRPAQGRML